MGKAIFSPDPKVTSNLKYTVLLVQSGQLSLTVLTSRQSLPHRTDSRRMRTCCVWVAVAAGCFGGRGPVLSTWPLLQWIGHRVRVTSAKGSSGRATARRRWRVSLSYCCASWRPCGLNIMAKLMIRAKHSRRSMLSEVVSLHLNTKSAGNTQKQGAQAGKFASI